MLKKSLYFALFLPLYNNCRGGLLLCYVSQYSLNVESFLNCKSSAHHRCEHGGEIRAPRHRPLQREPVGEQGGVHALHRACHRIREGGSII